MLGGDYVSFGDQRYVEPVAELLAPLAEAPYGSFAVLGNHDDDREMPAALHQRGFSVLRDQRTRLEIRGETVIWLVSVSGHGPPTWPDPRRHERDDVPPRARSATPHRGGRVRRPTRALGPYARRTGAAAGRWRHRRPEVSGAGGNRTGRKCDAVRQSWRRNRVDVPVRINCPPEVVLLTLQCAA